MNAERPESRNEGVRREEEARMDPLVGNESPGLSVITSFESASFSCKAVPFHARNSLATVDESRTEGTVAEALQKFALPTISSLCQTRLAFVY